MEGGRYNNCLQHSCCRELDDQLRSAYRELDYDGSPSNLLYLLFTVQTGPILLHGEDLFHSRGGLTQVSATLGDENVKLHTQSSMFVLDLCAQYLMEVFLYIYHTQYVAI